MSNRTVPATAEGMPSLTRRQALRTLAAGSAAGALAAGAVAAVTPAPALAATPIEDMTARLRAMLDADTHAMTDAQGDAHCAAFNALQERVIHAEAQTPRDVALQFMADTHWGASDMSDEFTDRLATMAGMGSVSADAVKAAPVADPMAEAVAVHEAMMKQHARCYARGDEVGAEVASDRALVIWREIQSDTPPAIVSTAGAMAAVRFVVDDKDWVDQDQAKVLRRVLAYLEGGAA